MNKDVLVVGLGEVGSAIYKLESESGNHPWALDIKALITPGTSVSYEVMHVCIPYSDKFEKIVLDYDTKYRPGIIIIHSTVPVGTTERINKQTDTFVAHSPVRGIHPNLYEGLLTFPKYVGSYDETAKSLASEHLAGLKLSVATMNNSDETELTKLLDTSYYGWCIMFAKEAKKYCDMYGADYHKVFTHANMTYNQGYTMLGKEKFVRPILIPPDEDGIAGHCISNNAVLLYEGMPSVLGKVVLSGGYRTDKLFRDKTWLYCEYLGKGKTAEQIGRECGVSGTTIRNYLISYNIPSRKIIWSESENELLEELSLEMTFKEIGDSKLLPTRTYEAIRIQASKLGIVSPYNPGEMGEQTRQKISCTLQGIPFNNFKGFITTEMDNIRRSLLYKEWRNAVFVRDGWKCAISGIQGDLNAHHIEDFASNPDKRIDVDNGISLNPSIHMLYHKLYGKTATRDKFNEFKNNKELIALVNSLKQEYAHATTQ